MLRGKEQRASHNGNPHAKTGEALLVGVRVRAGPGRLQALASCSELDARVAASTAAAAAVVGHGPAVVVGRAHVVLLARGACQRRRLAVQPRQRAAAGGTRRVQHANQRRERDEQEAVQLRGGMSRASEAG